MPLNKAFLAVLAKLLLLLLITTVAILIPLGIFLTAQSCAAVRLLGYLFLGVGVFSLWQLVRYLFR